MIINKYKYFRICSKASGGPDLASVRLLTTPVINPSAFTMLVESLQSKEVGVHGSLGAYKSPLGVQLRWTC